MEQKIVLVNHWQRMYKSSTIILTSLGALANLIMGGLYLLTPVMDAKTFAIVNFLFYILIGIGRMIHQPSVSGPIEAPLEPSEPVGIKVVEGKI